MVAELKISDKTSYPVWECFHNMSGVGACITLKALSYGVLVQQVIIYGVVTTTKESSKARLMQLTRRAKLTLNEMGQLTETQRKIYRYK